MQKNSGLLNELFYFLNFITGCAVVSMSALL